MDKIMIQLAKDLIDYANKNKLVEIGEVVETMWGNWKKPHKVKIYDISGTLVTLSGGVDVGIDIEYSARKIDKYGNIDKSHVRLALTNFRTSSGVKWEKIHRDFNHGGLSFSIPNPELEAEIEANGWWKSKWLPKKNEMKDLTPSAQSTIKKIDNIIDILQHARNGVDENGLITNILVSDESETTKLELPEFDFYGCQYSKIEGENNGVIR